MIEPAKFGPNFFLDRYEGNLKKPIKSLEILEFQLCEGVRKIRCTDRVVNKTIGPTGFDFLHQIECHYCLLEIILSTFSNHTFQITAFPVIQTPDFPYFLVFIFFKQFFILINFSNYIQSSNTIIYRIQSSSPKHFFKYNKFCL